MTSWFQQFQSALRRTASYLGGRLRSLLGQGGLTPTAYAQLEQVLYEADLGSVVVGKCLQTVRASQCQGPEELAECLKKVGEEILSAPSAVTEREGHPHVVLVVGVNGSGKTTSLAKLAQVWKRQGDRVLLVAGDTFRSAATEQLEMWAERLDIEIIKGKHGADPSSVVFDALTAAMQRGVGKVIIDTAGRLHNKLDLMKELEKIRRVCGKVVPGSPHEVLFVLDATTGQNGLEQAEWFHRSTPLTGIVVTKLDGTAKGGLVLAIYHRLRIPVRWVGVGEGVEDLVPFSAPSYLSGVFDA